MFTRSRGTRRTTRSTSPGHLPTRAVTPNADFVAYNPNHSFKDWEPACTNQSLGGSVSALQIIGSTLYIGGSFQNGAGETGANYLIACDLTTRIATPVGNPNDLNGGVYALTADANGTLYVGGQFGNAGGIPAADHIVAWDGAWHALGPGVDDYVRSLASSGTDVYVGSDSVTHRRHRAGRPRRALGRLGLERRRCQHRGHGRLAPHERLHLRHRSRGLAGRRDRVVPERRREPARRPHRELRRHELERARHPTAPATVPGAVMVSRSRSSARTSTPAAISQAPEEIRTRAISPATGLPPINAFTVGTATSNLRTGTATLTVKTRGYGKMTLRGADVLPATASTADKAGRVKLTIKARGAAKRRLDRLGHVTVKLKITFTPTGGTARTRAATVVLRKRV